MPLQVDIKEASFQSLIAWKEAILNSLPENDETKISYQSNSSAQKEVLKAINKLAAEDSIDLSRQDNRLEPLFQAIAEKCKDAVQVSQPGFIENAAQEIYENIIKKQDMQDKNQLLDQYKKAGVGGSLSLYKRSFQDEMTDSDIASFMPPPQKGIEVLTTLHRDDQQSNYLITQTVQSLLTNIQNDSLKAIIIPLGHEHYQGIYITKPKDASKKFSVELYDSLQNGYRLEETKRFLSRLLATPIENFEITLPSLNNYQSDIYACGDFVCAYSHKKIKDLGGENYDQKMIDAWMKGNENRELRLFFREKSEELENKKPDEKIPANQSKEEMIPKLSESENSQVLSTKKTNSTTHTDPPTIKNKSDSRIIKEKQEEKIIPEQSETEHTNILHNTNNLKQRLNAITSHSIESKNPEKSEESTFQMVVALPNRQKTPSNISTFLNESEEKIKAYYKNNYQQKYFPHENVENCFKKETILGKEYLSFKFKTPEDATYSFIEMAKTLKESFAVLDPKTMQVVAHIEPNGKIYDPLNEKKEISKEQLNALLRGNPSPENREAEESRLTL